MATLQAYSNGLTMGWPGNGGARENKRGQVVGWSAGAVRRHTGWLKSIDTAQLDGVGAAVTLTIRDCPSTSGEWVRMVDNLLQRFREADLLRWHAVVEWQRRGVPHLHLAVYAAPAWFSSPIRNTSADELGWWVVHQWRDVASVYRPGLRSQFVTPITGPGGWLKYLAKHASRGVRHYQRCGKPAGWETTGRLWRKGGSWPAVEPLRLQLTTEQAWRFRRLVRCYSVAEARSNALRLQSAGRQDRADAAWDSVGYLRRMLKSSDRSSPCRGVSAWVDHEDVIRLAIAAGWEGEMA